MIKASWKGRRGEAGEPVPKSGRPGFLPGGAVLEVAMPAYLKKTRFLYSAFLSALVLLTGCRSSGPALHPDSFLGEMPEEDINGVFPEAVYIKTRTQTFNTCHYYIIREGRIWYKSIDKTKEPGEWTLFEKTGLPHNFWKFGFNQPGKIINISADADELTALSEDGRFYRFCLESIITRPGKVWLDRQGWPVEEQLVLDERTVNNIAWALGKRNAHVLYYEDPFGNQHHNGTMEIATTYMLLEDGQEICYADTGLPSDFSRNYLGPERGAFKSVALSASASTMFVMNDAGEMYTRIADFDIIGCDPLFFKYTYIPYESDLPGTNYFSNLTEWGLPPEDWRRQPGIPLEEGAAISRFITILQNGQGNGARELRVAGVNGEGETGYWSKAIFDSRWEFKKVPLYFPPGALLRNGAERGQRSESQDTRLRGWRWNGGEKDGEYAYEIPNFNILEGKCELNITRGDERCVVTLHPVELWTYQKRDYLPGRTGAPKLFFTTLDFAPGAFEGLSQEFRAYLDRHYGKDDKKLFQYILGAKTRYVVLFNKDDTDSMLFLADESAGEITPDDLPVIQRTWYFNYDRELEAFNSPELAIGPDPLAGAGEAELHRKISLNGELRDKLRARISLSKKSKRLALGVSAWYLPLDGIVRYSLLRFIDVPKMRTITMFGQEIVLANYAYINATSNVQIWVSEKITGLLDLRIRVLTDLAKQAAAGRQAVPPPWFSEAVADYWSIAGLPAKVSGVFLDPSRPPGETPAELSFEPAGGELEPFGWYLRTGDSPSCLLFADPGKSIRAIFSREGRTPAEQALKIECTIYIYPQAGADNEKSAAERSLEQFVSGGSINAVISFDGENFIIREKPKTRANGIIFRGRAVF
jgi:hypothetical protein